jgi:chromosome segregation ATPase
MNDASTAMREWRQRQIDKAKRSDLPVPVALDRSFRQALEAIWSAAQVAASQALDEAQAAWDIERQEAQTLICQMGEAFDAQSREIQEAREGVEACERRRRDLRVQTEDLQAQLAQCQADALHAKAEAAQAMIKAEEAERRAADLRQELDHAHTALAERIKLDDSALARERSIALLVQEEASMLKRELAVLRGQLSVRQSAPHTRIPLAKMTRRRRLRKGTKHSRSVNDAKGSGDEWTTHSTKSQRRRMGHG